MDLIIRSERLILVPLQLSDAPDVFEYASDPEVARFTSWSAHHSIVDTEAFQGHVLSRHQVIPGLVHVVFAIRLNTSNQVIGTVSISQTEKNSAHLDYALSQHYWGQGLITEAVKNLIEWAFNEIQTLTELHSGCLSMNKGSVRVLEKCGFRLQNSYSSKRTGKFNNQILETNEYILLRSKDSNRP